MGMVELFAAIQNEYELVYPTILSINGSPAIEILDVKSGYKCMLIFNYTIH